MGKLENELRKSLDEAMRIDELELQKAPIKGTDAIEFLVTIMFPGLIAQRNAILRLADEIDDLRDES